MGRYIVLFLILLSLFSYPGNTSALEIKGEIWTNAIANAQNPSLIPPSAIADATFYVSDINFDSRRFDKPANITYNDFLNKPTWVIPTDSKFDPDKKMFNGNEKEGLFFRFTWPLQLSGGTLPVTVIHDDGFYLELSTGLSFPNFTDPVTTPEPSVTKFDLGGLAVGEYGLTLSFGALNDSSNHVLIVSTPEPGSMLLSVLGILGIGLLRRRS